MHVVTWVEDLIICSIPQDSIPVKMALDDEYQLKSCKYTTNRIEITHIIYQMTVYNHCEFIVPGFARCSSQVVHSIKQ